MPAEIDEICHVFSTNAKGTLDHRETAKALAALRLVCNEAELAKRLKGTEVDKYTLQNLVDELRPQVYTQPQLQQLLHDLMPHGKGLISTRTLQHILQTQHKVPPESFNVFLRHLKLIDKQEMIPIDTLSHQLANLFQADETASLPADD